MSCLTEVPDRVLYWRLFEDPDFSRSADEMQTICERMASDQSTDAQKAIYRSLAERIITQERDQHGPSAAGILEGRFQLSLIDREDAATQKKISKLIRQIQVSGKTKHWQDAQEKYDSAVSSGLVDSCTFGTRLYNLIVKMRQANTHVDALCIYGQAQEIFDTANFYGLMNSYIRGSYKNVCDILNSKWS